MSRLMFIPGMGLVSLAETYDPSPDLRYVTDGESEAPDSRAETPIRSRWVDRGLWAVVAVGAWALIADAAALWFAAWLIR